MSAKLTPFSFLLMTLAVAFSVLIGTIKLPHDPYLRFQNMSAASVHYLRAKWVFERIHFDATPIDVAFIGTSHTQSAIDSEFVEQVLREKGRDLHVVNFAIPHLGRDMHYLVVRELVENRRVSTLVVELQEGEARAPHPAFGLLGDVRDLVEAPLLVNTDYFSNLARLPQRQAALFSRTALPKLFDLQRDFQRDSYEGPHWNDTLQAHGIMATRTKIFPAEHFDQAVAHLSEVLESKQKLGRMIELPFFRHRLLYRYNLLYLEDLLDLAQRNGIDVVFLYLPFFRGPALPVDIELIKSYGPVLTPRSILDDASSWQNEDHFNVYGARRLSRWIGEQLDVVSRERGQ